VPRDCGCDATRHGAVLVYFAEDFALAALSFPLSLAGRKYKYSEKGRRWGGGDEEKERGEREKKRERGKKKRDEPRSSGRRLGRRNERWGYPGTYDSTEQAVKKAVALKASLVEE